MAKYPDDWKEPDYDAVREDMKKKEETRREFEHMGIPILIELSDDFEFFTKVQCNGIYIVHNCRPDNKVTGQQRLAWHTNVDELEEFM